jgi:PAS domain S-box-containing protein
VTERVSLEQALREGEERYRSLVELSPEAIVVHSLGIIIYVNEATVRLFNVRSRDDLIGRSFLDFVPPQSIDEVRRRMQNPPDPEAKREPMLVRSRRADGSEFILEALGSRVTYRGQPAGQVILRDITERVRAEQELTTSREQLRNLSTYLQSAREAERASIAREIHDELGGALTALKMDLAMIDDIFPPTGQTSLRAALQKKVDSMAELIDSTVKTMRRIVTALRPVLLDSLGLNAAIEWHAEDFQHRTGIVCTVRLPAEDTVLDRERSTAVYRIFQEALTNVARHAGATMIDASLHVEGSVLMLTVSDNGKGIRPDQLANTKSFGIMGMRERALIFGGEVTLTGIPGTGTTMSLRLPL